jgi:hypothetical protein
VTGNFIDHFINFTQLYLILFWFSNPWPVAERERLKVHFSAQFATLSELKKDECEAALVKFPLAKDWREIKNKWHSIVYREKQRHM